MSKKLTTIMDHSSRIYFKYSLISLFLFLFGAQIQTVHAQMMEKEESPVTVSAGMDIVSTYVWRGTAYSGPSIQPSIEVAAGGFAIGAWGSQGFDGFQEMDLYAGYSFDFGLSIGVTDYYYPDPTPFDTTDGTNSQFFDSDVHAFELNGGYTMGDLSLSANYIFAGEGSVGDDVYFEVGYTVGAANIFVGGGDGWHTYDGDFNIVNVGIGTSKEIQITDTFSLPVSGAVILNPDTEQLMITGGISL